MKKLRKPSSKKAIIIASVLIIIGLIVAYGVLSVTHWQSIQSDAAQQMRDAKQSAANITDTSLDIKIRRSAIESLAGRADAYKELCLSSRWYSWQLNVSGDARKAQKQCESDKTKLTALAVSAKTVDAYLRTEDKVKEALSKIKIDATQLNEKTWATEAVKGVQGALEAVKGLRATKDTQVLIDEASLRVAAINTRWEKLVIANIKQDKTAYNTALDGLDAAYARLADIADVSDASLSKLLDTLNRSIDQL